MSDWTPAFPLDAISPGGARLYRQDRDQVAVFRLPDDTVHAVDNRCPHEGYPLIQGNLSGCTVTCCFHNFKFDLRDGRCIKGDEDVRTFPVRVTDGLVELDMSPPDLSRAIPGYWSSLAAGLHERRIGQATRDCVRLLDAGVQPAELAAFVAGWDGERALYGATHALPLAADILQWAERYPGPRFAIPFAQVLDIAARDGVRRPPRDRATPEDPGDDPVAAGLELRRRVEAEDASGAEALLLGALARGWRRAELEPWFFQLCADHFLSFGHRLIYQSKAFDLLDAADWAHAEGILRGHLCGIVNGTREDVLPAWAGFRRRIAALDLEQLNGATWMDWGGQDALVRSLVEDKAGPAFDAVIDALRAGAPQVQVVDAISLAAAERMLRFDVAIDSDPSVQDSWLSVTHVQTFAHAVRCTLSRWDSPDRIRLILMAARFVNHHRTLDGAQEPIPRVDNASIDELPDAIAAKDAVRALGLAEALLEADSPSLQAAIMDLVITDIFAAPIVGAHVMKNLVVAFEELRATQDPRPVLALVRLLSSPLQQRWVHRGALEAVAFVTEGQIPKLLAP